MHRLLLTLLLLISAGAAYAKPGDVQHYRMDAVHSRVAFLVSHAEFSRAIGTFSQPEGSLEWVESDPGQSKTAVTISLSNLDLGDAEWNKKILSDNYFNEKKYPTATFTSEKVSVLESTPEGKTRLSIEGKLKLNNREVSVTLDATLNAQKRHPMTFKQTIGFSARTTLSRKAFGIDAWPKLIGDEVELLIETEWIKDSKGDSND
jgi:polyisoprenoid-binding protein YceI